MGYRTYTYFYLAVMICYLAGPVLPIIEYEVNKEYIANNLCIYKNVPQNHCQGTCHLMQQLQKYSNDITANTNNKKSNTENIRIDDHILVSTLITLDQEKSEYLMNISSIGSIHNYSDTVFVPPKSS